MSIPIGDMLMAAKGNPRCVRHWPSDMVSGGVDLDASEVFVSDGGKPDSANIQSIFGLDNVVAVQDPAYPVYVDSNVISGRTGLATNGQYEGLVYMPCTEENNFFPEVPSQKVDLIYICSPNNPTGAVATKSQLQTFVDYAREHTKR